MTTTHFHRARGVISWSTTDLVLRATRSAWLSTTRPDGRPHAAPVWFLWAEPILYFVTGNQTAKGRNLTAQPYAVLQLGDGDEVLIVEGPTRPVADGDERDRVDRGYGEKYVEPVTGERASVALAGSTLYRVDVARILTWTYGNVASRTDWVRGQPAEVGVGQAPDSGSYRS